MSLRHKNRYIFTFFKKNKIMEKIKQIKNRDEIVEGERWSKSDILNL